MRACGVGLLWLALAVPCFGAVGEGDFAPPVGLRDQSGLERDLAAEYGKHYVALFFYPKDDSPGCTREARGINAVYQGLLDMGFAAYGVSVQDSASKKAFCDKHGLKMPLLADVEKRVCEAFGTLMPSGLSARWTFVLDPALIVRQVIKDVDVDRHGDELLAALMGLKQKDADSALAAELSEPTDVLQGLKLSVPAGWTKGQTPDQRGQSYEDPKRPGVRLMVGDMPLPANARPVSAESLRTILQGAPTRLLTPITVGGRKAFRIEINAGPQSISALAWEHGDGLRGVVLFAPSERANDASRLLAQIAATAKMD